MPDRDQSFSRSMPLQRPKFYNFGYSVLSVAEIVRFWIVGRFGFAVAEDQRPKFYNFGYGVLSVAEIVRFWIVGRFGFAVAEDLGPKFYNFSYDRTL